MKLLLPSESGTCSVVITAGADQIVLGDGSGLSSVPVSKGGTGLSSLPIDQVLVGNGSSMTTRSITAVPVNGDKSLFTSGGAYTELAKKLDTSKTITINGVSQLLNSNPSFTIESSSGSGGTTGLALIGDAITVKGGLAFDTRLNKSVIMGYGYFDNGEETLNIIGYKQGSKFIYIGQGIASPSRATSPGNYRGTRTVIFEFELVNGIVDSGIGETNNSYATGTSCIDSNGYSAMYLGSHSITFVKVYGQE